MAAVGLPDVRNPVAKHHIANEQHTALREENRCVFRRMGRPHVLQLKLHSTDREHTVVCTYPFICLHQVGVGIDPWRQLGARGRQTQRGRFGVDVLSRQAVGNDLGAQRLEDLQAIDVVSVVMRQQHRADGFVRDLPDFLHQRLGQCGRAQRIDHHHAVLRDDETSIGDEVLVLRRTQRRQALHVVHIGGYRFDLHRDGCCRRARRAL
ncbi:hypothetical protein D3C72_1449640 [compost metagenome]